MPSCKEKSTSGLYLNSEIRSDKVCDFFKMLTNCNRWKIVASLRSGSQCVCQIEQTLGLPQNLTSHHLKKLEQVGVVGSERKGTKVYYHLNKQYFGEQLSLLQNFFS